MADVKARLRELLAKAESEDRLAPVFVYGVTVDNLRAVLDRAALLDEALDALDDLVQLAGSAMAQANNDGAEYDAKTELEDALAVLAKAGRR